MTETPIPPLEPIIQEFIDYGIIWTLVRGNAIYNCPGDDMTDMDRDNNDIPIIPNCDGDLRFNDDRTRSDDEGELSWFHTEYKWNSVKITYSFKDNTNNSLSGFKIRALPYRRIKRLTTNQPDEGPDVEEYLFGGYVPYRVRDCKFNSKDPNDSGTWKYPDDYDVVEDPNHPTQYGGVVLYENETPVTRKAGEDFEMGIDDGNDGVYEWIDSNGRKREIFSGYRYSDVFDDLEFGFIPRNSYENDSETKDFPITPYYPDVKDPNGLAAPIYPMNAITSFLPDPREEVTVTYVAELDIDILDSNGNVIDAIVQNNKVKIKQTVEQETGDYIKQLEQLQGYCMFNNPGEFKPTELSRNYNYDYPYTMVSSKAPKKRDNKDSLERGDVWFQPGGGTNNGGTRKIWSIADIPERFTIINGGKNYRDRKRVMAMKLYEMDKSFDKDLYPKGRPPKGYEKIDMSIGSGLFVDIETKNGEIVKVTMDKDLQPSGWKDGDIIRIFGGNNDAEVRIHIDNPPGWVDYYIDKY